MGDRSAATVEVFGVAGKEVAIAEILGPHGFSTEWGSYGDIGPNEIVDGTQLVVDEVSLGIEEEISEPLAELGISYVISQCSKYEYDGWLVMSTPDLGRFSTSANANGDGVAIAADSIDKLLDEAEASDDSIAAFATLCGGLDKLTGRVHRRHFEALRKALPAVASA